jgi:hypothetical protein
MPSKDFTLTGVQSRTSLLAASSSDHWLLIDRISVSADVAVDMRVFLDDYDDPTHRLFNLEESKGITLYFDRPLTVNESLKLSGGTAGENITVQIEYSEGGSVVSGVANPEWSPADISELILWLDAEQEVLDANGNPASDGVNVDEWKDQSGCLCHATQPVDGVRPHFVLDGIGGKPAVRFTAANVERMILPLAESSGDFSMIVVANAITVGDYRYFIDSQTGRIVFAHGSSGTKVAFYDGTAFRGTATPVTGEQLLTYVLKGTNSGAIYKDGVALDTGLPYAAKALGGAARLCGDYSDTGANFNGLIAEILLYKGALSDASRKLIRRYLSRKYSLTVA